MNTYRSDDHLFFYCDCHPDEQLINKYKGKRFHFVCVFIDNLDIVEKEMKQFKDSGNRERRKEYAKQLIVLIKEKRVHPVVFSSEPSFSLIEMISGMLLKEVQERDKRIVRTSTGYEFMGIRVNFAQAKMCFWYSIILTIFSSGVSRLTLNSKKKKFVIAIDPLPGDEPEKGRTDCLDFLKLFLAVAWSKTWNGLLARDAIERGEIIYLFDRGDEIKRVKSKKLDWLYLPTGQRLHCTLMKTKKNFLENILET